MKSFIGILILSTGVIFLLANTGIIDTEMTDLLSTFWPAIIVLFGIKIIFEGLIYFLQGLKRDKWHIGKVFWGSIVIAIGAVLLGNNAGWFQYGLTDLWSWTWPLLIVYAGFKVLFDRDGNVVIRLDGDEFNKKNKKSKKKSKVKEDVDDYSSFNNKYQHEWKASSSKKRKTWIGDMQIGKHPWELDGLDLSMWIGDIGIDLSKAILKEGENVIDVRSWIGSVQIYVPKEMALKAYVNVDIGEVTLFDDTYSGTSRNAVYTSPDYHEADQKVIINVHLNIGDVEVLTVD